MTPINSVAVLYGGTSAEREISLLSGAAIAKGLEDKGYQVELFDTQSRLLTELLTLDIDVVFIALHGRGGEDGSVQGALQHLGFTYTGSGVLGSALAMDKVRSKFLFSQANLSTAPYRVIYADDVNNTDYVAILDQLNGKVMVKPSNEGSSIGMKQANTVAELKDAVIEAFKYDDSALVEQWIDGREFTVGVLGNLALPVIELRTPELFYDYQAKYKLPTTEYLCPCDLETSKQKELREIALKAFNLLGASGWGRVDFLMDDDGSYHLLEVNTVPGMTQKSLVPMAAKQQGHSFADLVEQILHLAVSD